MVGLADSLGSQLGATFRSLAGAGHLTGVDLASPLMATTRQVEEIRRIARSTSLVASAFRTVGSGVGAPRPLELPRWITRIVGDAGPGPSADSAEARYAANRVAARILVDSGLVEDPSQRNWLRSLSEPGPLGEPRQIWWFSLPHNGDEGRVIEVWGDLERADHVAILVPGMGTTAENFDERVATRARNLYERANSLDSGAVAVVGWFDYDAPDGIPSREVLSEGQALSGGARLNAFLARVPEDPDRHVTLVGHSYGSVVVGAAMFGSMAAEVDDVLVMGSPGTGVDSVEEFAAPETGFYTMEAPMDPVPNLDWFGTNPNELDSGFRRVETGPRPGHSSYLAQGTEGLENAALIVTGRGSEARVRGRSAGEWIEEAGLQMDHLRDELRQSLPDSVIPGGYDDEVLDRIEAGLALGDSVAGFVEEVTADVLRDVGDLARLEEMVLFHFPGVHIPDPPPVPDWSVLRNPILVPVIAPLRESGLGWESPLARIWDLAFGG